MRFFGDVRSIFGSPRRPERTRRAAALVDVFARRGHAAFEGGANAALNPRRCGTRSTRRTTRANPRVRSGPARQKTAQGRVPAVRPTPPQGRPSRRLGGARDDQASQTPGLARGEAFVAATLCKPHLGRRTPRRPPRGSSRRSGGSARRSRRASPTARWRRWDLRRWRRIASATANAASRSRRCSGRCTTRAS